MKPTRNGASPRRSLRRERSNTPRFSPACSRLIATSQPTQPSNTVRRMDIVAFYLSRIDRRTRLHRLPNRSLTGLHHTNRNVTMRRNRSPFNGKRSLTEHEELVQGHVDRREHRALPEPGTSRRCAHGDRSRRTGTGKGLRRTPKATRRGTKRDKKLPSGPQMTTTGAAASQYGASSTTEARSTGDQIAPSATHPARPTR